MISKRRYSLMFFTNILLLITDLAINGFSNFAQNDNISLLVLYLVQDVCLICGIISIGLSCFSLSTYQCVGVNWFNKEFKITVLVSLLYLFITISLHISTLTIFKHEPVQYRLVIGLFVILVIQRTVAPGYYYLYLRSFLNFNVSKYSEEGNETATPEERKY